MVLAEGNSESLSLNGALAEGDDEWQAEQLGQLPGLKQCLSHEPTLDEGSVELFAPTRLLSLAIE